MESDTGAELEVTQVVPIDAPASDESPPVAGACAEIPVVSGAPEEPAGEDPQEAVASPDEAAPAVAPAEYLAEVVPIGVAHPAPPAEEAPEEEAPEEEAPPPATPTETAAADLAPAVLAPVPVAPAVEVEPAEVPPVLSEGPAPASVRSETGVRRTIERVYLRSVLRFSALFSLVAGLIFLLLGGLAYFVLAKTGEVRAFETFLQNGGYPTFRVQASSVFGMLFVLVVVASVLFVTVCLLWAWIYNLVADASGGIEVLTRE